MHRTVYHTVHDIPLTYLLCTHIDMWYAYMYIHVQDPLIL